MSEANCRWAVDAEAVGRVLSGDRDAYRVLVEKHWKTAVAAALSKLGSTHDAEEAAEEAFVAAYLNLAALRDGAKFAPWLMKIVAQKSVMVLRRRVISRRVHVGIEENILYQPSANPGLTTEQLELVRSSVMKLPEKLRTAVLLRYVAGLSSIEIAERINRRPGTVRTWLHRAYGKLRRELAPVFGR